MPVIFNVSITPTGEENRFRVVWYNPETNERDSFFQAAAEIDSEEKEKQWQKPENQLETGRKLFRLLDGDARHLQRALDEAAGQGESLRLNLRACAEVADWPFELLAMESEEVFLVPARLLHLVRHVSGWGEKRVIHPRRRALKLLFMACSALDVKPELDFEREEEIIYRITEKMAIDMDVEDSGSLEGLGERLEQQEYDIVHISGHADIDKKGRPFFIMEDEMGKRRDVFPHELWKKALLNNPPRLLFLSGCRTGETPDTDNGAAVSFARRLVEKYQLPAVLGWGRPVSDKQATHAEKIIYGKLSHGKSILKAVQLARYELKEKFAASLNPSWPLLRLFSSGVPLNQIVVKGRRLYPHPTKLKYIYLKNSNVKVLKEGFVGRRRQLQQGMRAFKQDDDKVGLLLLGTGGLGKSCLAGKICQRFPGHTLIIVHGKLNTVTLQAACKDSFVMSRDTKGKKILERKTEMKDKLVDLCATSFMRNNYLILLDDFEQNMEGATAGRPGPLTGESADLLKVLLHYLPLNGGMTQMIITSRYDFSLTKHSKDLVGEHLEKIYLTGFREPEQRKKGQGLRNLLNYPNQSIFRDLLAAGHGNPRLMEWIDILVGQMEEEDIPGLLTEVGKKQVKFIREHVIRELLKYGGGQLTQLLRRASIFRRFVLKEGVRLLATGAEIKNWEELLLEGMRLSLIEHDWVRRGYRLTPLLQAEFLSELNEEETQNCHKAAFTYYKEICATHEHLDPIFVEEYIFHSLGSGEEDTASKQGTRLVKHFREHLSFRESRRVGLWILSEKKQKLSLAHDASLLNETALTLRVLSEYDDAIKLYNKSLVIDRKLYGKMHMNAARDLNNLGLAWSAKGNPQKAVKLYDQALKIVGASTGEIPHEITGWLLNNLGSAWSALGEHKMGIAYYEQALSIWKEHDNENNEIVAIVLNNLGSIWNDSGDHKKAIKYYKKALAIERSIYGNMHPDVALVLNNLGKAWYDSGDYQRATWYSKRALNIWKKIYGEKHLDVAAAMKNLGSALNALDEPEKALELMEQAFDIVKSTYGEEDEKAAAMKNDLELVRSTLAEKT